MGPWAKSSGVAMVVLSKGVCIVFYPIMTESSSVIVAVWCINQVVTFQLCRLFSLPCELFSCYYHVF